jgi:hypothetical protein
MRDCRLPGSKSGSGRWSHSEEIGWVHSQEIGWSHSQEIRGVQSQEILHQQIGISPIQCTVGRLPLG